ncbi:hypothetical protein [Flavobacterium sp.]|uniref:hypothetical protein n=1 Tax=Flavobacterium sp. TaxID=239 RepID=UPI00260BEFB1|nr:hypothetical protein [Flavobacterium sp.]
MNVKIKIGFLISYDYAFLYDSLKLVYDFTDEIFLAIDINRRTWSGNQFYIEDSFFEYIEKIDIDKKIKIYQDDFYIEALSPIENDTRERNLLSEQMGENCWKLHIDVDEFFLNFDLIVDFLNKNKFLLFKPNQNQANIRANWITLFKRTSKGFLYIDENEHFSFANNVVGKHVLARDLDAKGNTEIFTNFKAIHQSWARNPEEILIKITNWGHKNDFDSQKYFDFWMSVNEENYMDFSYFHPYDSRIWKSLKYCECENLEDFIAKYNERNQPQKLPKLRTRLYKKHLKNIFRF